MLLSLRIENFALVDRLELELGPGLHVLTGETGAGKSIILDALDAVLGGKIHGRVVRTGETRAILEGTFQVSPRVTDWLIEQDISPLDDGTLICSRDLTLHGGSTPRSRSRVNGIVVNKQQLESLRDRLVELTAQGQTVLLGKSQRQREWLDAYGGATLLAQRDRVAQAYALAQGAKEVLDRRRQSETQRLQQMDLLNYQAKELDEAELDDPQELEQLLQEVQRLSHVVDLQDQSYQIYQLIYQNDHESDAAADLLGKAEAILHNMAQVDESLQPLADLVGEAMTQVQEVGQQIHHYANGLETDPARLAEVETRIQALKRVCKKYGPTLAEAIAHRDKVNAELAQFQGGGQSLEDLEAAYEAAQQKLRQTCQQLTPLRQAAARQLEADLVTELKPLAMEKVQFSVTLIPCSPSALGGEQISFWFSPNPGEPLQPLSETASGGEMSRFLLALKACFSQIDSVGTMVFDEIDTGVSGRVSQAIAAKLQQLSRAHQVLCVTHQPLIAAVAHRHLRVSKVVLEGRGGAGGDRTVIRITPLLTHDQRRQELAELAGGRSAQEALTFADSLLVQAATQSLEESLQASQGDRAGQAPPSQGLLTQLEEVVTPVIATKRNKTKRAGRRAKVG
jgi:DNA repair protein RecN (Recombination protein N)